MLTVVSIDQALRIQRQGKAMKKAHNGKTTWWVTTEGKQVQENREVRGKQGNGGWGRSGAVGNYRIL